MSEKVNIQNSGIFLSLCRGLDKISWFALFVMMMLTVADVLLRKLMNSSILGTVELTELIMVVVIYFSMAQTQNEDGHIQIDLFVKRMKEKNQAKVDFFTQLICTLLFGLIGISSFIASHELYLDEEVTLDLELPIFPFAYITAVGCSLLCLALFFKTMEALSRMLKP